MKFLHTADIHLGAKPDAGAAYTQSREKELWNSFQHVVEVCEEAQVDLLLIAGDLFHRQPLLRELKDVSYLLGKLTHTQVVLSAGNHDFINGRKMYICYREKNWKLSSFLNCKQQYRDLATIVEKSKSVHVRKKRRSTDKNMKFYFCTAGMTTMFHFRRRNY